MSSIALELAIIQESIPNCHRCPELRQYCKAVARTKRRAFQDWQYWGQPVPAFGDPEANIMIVGLAPAAHGANRTGRMFTGDRSGEFLYNSLYRVGLANQSQSERIGDGLKLNNLFITAAARCAPPANRPSPLQLSRCQSYLVHELQLLRPRAIVCLGAIAWNATLSALAKMGCQAPRPRPKFGHGAAVQIGFTTLLGCYHVSQQNTFTGRLTAAMLDVVLRRAITLASDRVLAEDAASGRA